MPNNYGVIVARFQVPELHLGHMHLINEAIRIHGNDVVVLLGDSGSAPTDINPLSYDIRKVMIKQHFPHLFVDRLPDIPDDQAWSDVLDQLLSKHEGVPILYGSRKSFKPHYKGKHPVITIEPVWERSGTDIRAELMQPIHTTNFRAGMIHQTMRRFPIVYPTVDIACFKFEPESSTNFDISEAKTYLLMGKKKYETLWRFPGGFVDPDDLTFLHAAKRELIEEASHIEVSDWKHVGSVSIPDPRYIGTKDCIKSTLFQCRYIYGGIKASDDLMQVDWIPYDDKIREITNPIHHPLLNLLEGK